MIKLLWRRLFARQGGQKELPCREVVSRVTDFLDFELDAEMEGRIREHLDVCTACRHFVNSLENTIRSLHSDASCTIPDEKARQLLSNLRAEHRRALEELDEKAAD